MRPDPLDYSEPRLYLAYGGVAGGNYRWRSPEQLGPCTHCCAVLDVGKGSHRARTTPNCFKNREEKQEQLESAAGRLMRLFEVRSPAPR